MLHGSSSPGFAGSELTRLLARLADAPPADSRPVFAERLAHWLGWVDTIALSSALTPGAASTGKGAVPAPAGPQADFQRVRLALEASIAAPCEPGSSPADFAPWRRHCIAQQQAMHDAIGGLRQRLRQALSQCSPGMARLAAIDAVMDQALAPQERGLLGLVPLRLQAHFERLRRAAGDDSRWQDAFQQDMRLVLRAELAHRLLPAQGLLNTLLTFRAT